MRKQEKRGKYYIIAVLVWSMTVMAACGEVPLDETLDSFYTGWVDGIEDTVLGHTEMFGEDEADRQETKPDQTVHLTDETTLNQKVTDQTQNVPERANSFLMKEATEFAYDTLTLMQQEWYRQIADSLGTMAEETRLNLSVLTEGVREEDIDLIFQCVMMDHPELFFVEGYTYTKYTKGESIAAIAFKGTWNMSREEAEQRKILIDSAVAPILAEAARCENDYERVKYVYETIIQNTEYDMQAPDNQNIYSVFVSGRSVCQGYAKATQYLLNRLGMEATLVQGVVDTGEKHAWDLVKVSGSYYYVDTTWGDASYQMEGEAPDWGMPEINYDYLCINTEQLLRTHTLDMPVPLPYCVDVRDNYYVREGIYFTEVNSEQLREAFANAYDNVRDTVSIKCADSLVFSDMERYLIDEEHIFDYLRGNSKVNYIKMEDRNLFLVYLN